MKALLKKDVIRAARKRYIRSTSPLVNLPFCEKVYELKKYLKDIQLSQKYALSFLGTNVFKRNQSIFFQKHFLLKFHIHRLRKAPQFYFQTKNTSRMMNGTKTVPIYSGVYNRYIEKALKNQRWSL
jgi:hypothetical protein